MAPQQASAAGKLRAESRAVVGLTAVIVSVDGTTPRMLTVASQDGEALPSRGLDDSADTTLEKAVRRLVSSDLGLPVRYFEQLYTFGDRERSPGCRALAVAYLALARYQPVTGSADPRWHDCYELFPWEDWRQGRPAVLDSVIVPALERWLGQAPPAQLPIRTERAELTFGTGQALWDPMRVLDRYELLYELMLVDEADRDRRAGLGGPCAPHSGGSPGGGEGAGIGEGAITGEGAISGEGAGSGETCAGGEALVSPDATAAGIGAPLALDHRRIAAAALERLRGKLAYRPVVFEVLPEAFTLSALQQVVEAFAGQVLHKQNFRRLVASANLVEPTGELQQRTGGRPAELYRFRREVLRERPAPGLGLRRLGGP